MRLSGKTFHYFIGAVLLGAATSSVAVSLGRVRAAALVGRPLDAVLSAQLDPSENASNICIAVDVFFGDSQVSADKVRITTVAGPAPGEVVIRVRTSHAIDEPVVTLYAREGCFQKNTRKYVLLAEALGDNVISESSAAGQSPAGSADVNLLPMGRQGTAKADSLSMSGQKDRAPVRQPMPKVAANLSPASRTAEAQRPAQTAPLARLSPRANAPRARLKLDPIDLSAEQAPVLRQTLELLTPLATDPAQRASAAALWQALSVQPEDIARTSQRLKSIEADVAVMAAQARKTDIAVVELKSQLERAREERYANWLVYGLCGAVLLVLGLAAALWVRGRNMRLQRDRWWDGHRDLSGDFDVSVEPAMQQADAASQPKSEAKLRAAGHDSHKSRRDSQFKRSVPARAVASRGHSEFLPSIGGVGGMPRIVNAEELFDVQQQADFFLSLGHPEKAVEVLRHHIMDNVETSALVYLDLFDLYHQLGREEDYETLRKEFHRKFNAEVPAFEDYAMDSHGLEFYVEALTRIESLWPTPKVLDVLEESIFRKPGSRDQVFSLAAYRDLLLLHSIAKKVTDDNRGYEAVQDTEPLNFPPILARSGAQHGAGFSPTDLLPLSARLHDAAPSLPDFGLTDLKRPPVSSRLGLDIDLTEGIDHGMAPVETPAYDNLLAFDLEPPTPPRDS